MLNSRKTLAELPDRIPTELKSCPQWVSYWLTPESARGRLLKQPVNPMTGCLAKSNDSSTWGTFEQAILRAMVDDLPGVGFVFSAGDPFVGIDLDHCVCNGSVGPWAQTILSKVNSYAEVSCSGTGIHIIAKAKLPELGRRKDGIEIYDSLRFFAITGNTFSGMNQVCNRASEIAELHHKWFGNIVTTPVFHNPTEVTLDDSQLLTKIAQSKNGIKTLALWSGNWQSQYPSQSEADYALCSSLAFWCGGDPGRVDRMFRQSMLYRHKWDQIRHQGKTYGELTINRAVQSTKTFYEYPDCYPVIVP